MCALWKQSLSSLAEKHAQWKFNQVLQVLCKVLPTLLQHSSGYCNHCFAWEAHRFSGAQRVPLTSKPQLTAQHFWPKQKTLSKPQHWPGLGIPAQQPLLVTEDVSMTWGVSQHRAYGVCIFASHTYVGKREILNCPGMSSEMEKKLSLLTSPVWGLFPRVSEDK